MLCWHVPLPHPAGTMFALDTINSWCITGTVRGSTMEEIINASSLVARVHKTSLPLEE
jgi:hypothetical protein